jgi:two-component system, chemotaxis family, protein-glutamate methylesterase/glutaminase
MPNRDLVVIGGSAGAVDALIRVVGDVPADLAATILVVVHVPADSTSRLPDILSRAGPLPAKHARDGDPLRLGEILVAPPDFHLVVRAGRVGVVRGPRENLHRPAVDPLFRSAAAEHGDRVVGVILSGALDDGAAGMRAVRQAGGVSVVQDPQDCIVPSMPNAALTMAGADEILSADSIGGELSRLLALPTRRREESNGDARIAKWETDMAEMSAEAMGAKDRPGDPSPFACPDCGGVLWEIEDDGRLRFRCRVGHAFSVRALMAAQDGGLEDSLWAALRALEEREALTRRLIDRTSDIGSGLMTTRLERRAAEAGRQAETLRRFLMTQSDPQATDPLSDVGHTPFDEVGAGVASGGRKHAAAAPADTRRRTRSNGGRRNRGE